MSPVLGCLEGKGSEATRDPVPSVLVSWKGHARVLLGLDLLRSSLDYWVLSLPFW